jgi:dTDP-4-dehydrorhamnose 3,5-epimerase
MFLDDLAHEGPDPVRKLQTSGIPASSRRGSQVAPRRPLVARTLLWPVFMIFTETPLRGALIIDLERRADERGFFARAFCQHEFAAHGLKPAIAQVNIGFNHRKGTIRGMHFQYPPTAETKLVRCSRGAILDIIVDLRPESPTYLQHISVELTAENHRGIMVPERCGHGYQTLEDNTETTYHVGEFYAPGSESGLRYDDAALKLNWPLPVTVISEKDLQWKPLPEIESVMKSRMSLEAGAVR